MLPLHITLGKGHIYKTDGQKFTGLWVAKTKHYVHRDQELKISSNRVTVQTDQSLV